MRKSITLLLMAAAIAVFTGCEDDSSSKKDTVLETGNSTIRGNITDTGDISARSVSAKVAATIPVWLKGTTTETYTDQNGSFIFENIPAGDYTICFEIGGKTYEYPVSVSEGATLIISNLGVSADGTVVVGSVRESTSSSNGSAEPQSEPEDESEVDGENSPSAFSSIIPSGLRAGNEARHFCLAHSAISNSGTNHVSGATKLLIDAIDGASTYHFTIHYPDGYGLTTSFRIENTAPEVSAPYGYCFVYASTVSVYASNANDETTKTTTWTGSSIPHGLSAGGGSGFTL